MKIARRSSSPSRGWSAAWLACLCTIIATPPAFAYRPFDGTDASVADLGKIEVELQPVGGIQEGVTKTLIAPATIFNYGFAKDWEAVLQGQLESQIAPTSHESLTTTGAFLKHVWVPGVLQDQTGPSLATEFGVLLPSIGAPATVKPSLDVILSQRYDWGTLHFNVAVNEFSDPRLDLFFDAIIEGPSNWKVRPVAEIYSDSTIGGPQVYSGLVGLIWRVSDDLAVDFGLRHAIADGHNVNELRAGLTIAFPVDGLSKPLADTAAMRPAMHNPR